jgi:CheY-like chemotaxis protein
VSPAQINTPSEKATVLVVDDDPAILDALEQDLADQGYDVILAHDGDEGLRYLRSAPPPDAILLDLFMPRMNGWEFMHALRSDEALPEPPVIVITAIAPHWGYPIPKKRVVRKPIRLEKLLALLREATGNEFTPTRT